MFGKKTIDGLTFVYKNGLWILQSEEVCQKTYNDMKEINSMPLHHKNKTITYVKPNEINNVCLLKSDLKNNMLQFWKQSGLTKEEWITISAEIDNIKGMIGDGADKTFVNAAIERMSEIQLVCYHTFFKNPVQVINYTSGIFETTKDDDKYRIIAVRVSKQFNIPVIFN